MAVTLLGEHVEARGHLEAFSDSSFWIRADVDVEEAYASLDHLDVEFELPWQPVQVCLHALIAEREVLERAVYYRLELESAPPPSLMRCLVALNP